MSTNSINGLSSSYLQSILGSALQNAGVTNKNGASGTSSVSGFSDNGGLSPFAQIMSTLQQLQQSNPTQYAQVTKQIATNLQTAAQTAQSEGNTTAASQLNQLATDFNTASTSGQLPNIQDLAQALGGQAVGGHHHHHHHHAQAASSDSSSDASTSSTASSASTSGDSTSGASQMLSQLLSAIQGSGSQNDALNPMSIIMSTLSSAGIATSNG
jgi:hypothetical protein